MDLGHAREIIADDLDRIAAAQHQMAGIGGHPDIFGIGMVHHPAHVFFPLQRSPDMGMRRQAHAHGDGLGAQFVQGVGQALELLLAGAAGRARAHVDLPVIAAQGLQEIAAEGDVIGHGLGDLVRIDEVGGLALLAIGGADEGDVRRVHQLLQFLGIGAILLDAVAIEFDALQAELRDALDRPGRLVSLFAALPCPAPDRAGGAEQNVRIHRVQRLVLDGLAEQIGGVQAAVASVVAAAAPSMKWRRWNVVAMDSFPLNTAA